MTRDQVWWADEDNFWRSPLGFAAWGVLLGLLAWSWTGRVALAAACVIGGAVVGVSLYGYRRSRR